MNLFSVNKSLLILLFGLFIEYTLNWAQDNDGILSSLDMRVQAETSENDHKIVILQKIDSNEE